MEKQERNYTITKRIAQHGKQAIILIPKYLQEQLPPRTIVEVKINVVKEAD